MSIRVLLCCLLFYPFLVQAETAIGNYAYKPSSLGTERDYVLGVGDLIRINVHGEEDLKLEARLVERGTITYPFLGEIPVLGITAGALERRIATGLRGDYLKHPEVQVNVLQYRPFYVNGEVRSPGGYPYIPGLTVQNAAAVAGGLTDRASKTKIFLIRESDVKQSKVPVNLDTQISPGDTLIIEEGLF